MKKKKKKMKGKPAHLYEVNYDVETILEIVS